MAAQHIYILIALAFATSAQISDNIAERPLESRT
jgi:hypothetical protein